MKERLINHVSLTRRLRQLLVLLTLLLLPAGMWAENVSTTYTFTGTTGSSESGYQYDVASTADEVNYTWRVKNFSAKNENQANMGTSAYVLSETSFGISNIYSSYDKSTIIDFMLESDFTLTGDFVSAEITYSTTGMSQSKAVVYKVAEYNYTLTDATVALGESPATLSLNATDYKSFEGNKIALQFTFTAAKTGNSTTLFTIESIKITTDVTTYPLWVGGTQVTSANLSDIKDNNILSGTVSFDQETNTLTLDNATIDMSNTYGSPVSSSIANLKVKLLGDNTFKLYTDKPYAFEYTGEENTRTLTFETEWQQDEYGYYLGLLKIDNTTETENVAKGYTISNTFDNLGTTTYIDPEEAENMTSGWKIGTHTAGPNDIEPDFVKVWKLEVYDLWIGSGRVISSALEAGQSGGPRYNPVDQALAFTSLTSYPIKSSLPELKISVNGSACGINYESPSTAAITFQATDQQTTGTLKFVVPAEVANNQINKFTVNCANGVISGFSEVTIEEPLVLRTPTEEPDTWDANTKTLVISNIDDSNLFGGGDGTDAEHAYVISSPLELKLFADKYNNANSGMEKNCYVELGDDIDCTDLTGFTPIGLSSGAPFWGKFDGKGYTISKLTYSTTEANGYTGLFGVVGYYDNGSQECYVQNLNLENCSFSGGEKNGAIAAIFGSGTIRYCNVTNCSISTSGGIGSPLCGGIAGEVTDGAITNCTVSGLTMNVSTTTDDGAPFVGGIAGQTAHGVSNCIVTGTEEHPTVITGTTGPGGGGASGGIVGLCSAAIEINNNMVSDYTTIKSIDPTTFNTDYSCAGAIVGNTGDGTLTNNIYYYSVTTSNKKGEADAVVKDGYTQRGIGNSAEDGSGVEMYTRSVTLPGENEQGAVIAEEGTYYGWNASETGVLVAPGQTATINVNPGNGYTIASLTATNTTTEEPIETDSEEWGDGIVQYTFEMPDADVTLNVTFTKSYDLWIGETQVTELNADDVLGDDGTVSFTPEDATNATPATLTLNGAELTAPLVVGLENLTIDIQGENSITTDYTCIQTMDEETTPSLTFKSTSSTVGSLTLTNTDEESLGGVLSSDFFGKFTISKELALILFRDGYTSNSYYLTAGEVHNTQFVPSLGVQVGEIQVYAGNAANVLYDAETPTAVYDVENHKLTLNGARISGAISTSLENLTIELVGNNSIYQGGSYATLQSMYGEAVTMTIQSTGATPGTLTMNQPYTQAGTFADAHVTLDITSPLTVLSGSLTGNKDNENTVVIGAYTVAFAGSNSWATYYGTKDFTVPEGLTAYPVSSVNETTGVVTVPEQELSYIPANTGVLLKRTDTTVSDYAFTAYTGQTTNITSILQGTSEATSVGGILKGYTEGSTVYVLYNDAFVKTTSGTIPANRGFLVFGDELNAPRLTIEIEGEATGINTVQGAGVMDNDYYDLSGRKLSGKPTKSGLYIKNGTKVLVK